MAQALLPEDLWPRIAAHLPNHCRPPKGGWPRIDNRAPLTGILFVLRTAIPWEDLPRELGCGSGMTCSRRLHEWMQVGVCSVFMKRCCAACANTTRTVGFRAVCLPPKGAGTLAASSHWSRRSPNPHAGPGLLPERGPRRSPGSLCAGQRRSERLAGRGPQARLPKEKRPLTAAACLTREGDYFDLF